MGLELSNSLGSKYVCVVIATFETFTQMRKLFFLLTSSALIPRPHANMSDVVCTNHVVGDLDMSPFYGIIQILTCTI